jgi:large subunit ribosomal protein L9
MAINIQVVLREDVPKLGKIGELVKVKPGFARNYLLPRGLGVVATEGNIQQIEHERKAAIANAAKLKKSFEAIAQQLSTVTIKLTKQAGDEDKLYGSVTSKEVSDALKAKGFDVEKKRIELPEVRHLGTFDVKAKLAPEVVATFKLEVVKK